MDAGANPKGLGCGLLPGAVHDSRHPRAGKPRSHLLATLWNSKTTEIVPPDDKIGNPRSAEGAFEDKKTCHQRFLAASRIIWQVVRE